MKALIATGGTGGHIYPGVVLGKELLKKNCELFFTAPRNVLTFKILERENFSFVGISCAPVFGQSWSSVLKAVLQNLRGMVEGLALIRKLKPDCVIGFGSYASVPMVLAAFLKRVPIFLHEQNFSPGWANRFCSIFSKKVAVSFNDSLEYFPKKSLLIGNLLREEIFDHDSIQARRTLGLRTERATILIFGGSAGAKRINQWILRSLDMLSDLKDSVQFLHISGHQAESRKLKEKYDALRFHSVVLDYAHAMGDCYASADLAICRAGATTVAELIATQTPAILVPYPHAIGSHQKKNGLFLEKLGAAVVIPESDFLDHQLSSEVRELLQEATHLRVQFHEHSRALVQSTQRLKKMREAYAKFPIDLKEAPKKMAQAVLELAGTSLKQ